TNVGTSPASGSGIYINRSDSSTGRIQAYNFGTSTALSLSLQPVGGGKVGIGEDSPDELLHITSASGTESAVRCQSGTSDSANWRFGLQNQGSGRGFIVGEINSGDNQLNIGFGVTTNGVPASTVLHINRNNQVCINATSITTGYQFE